MVGLLGLVIHERVINHIEGIRARFKPVYVAELETETNKFIRNLQPGKIEKLLDTDDGGMRIYHMGTEIRVVPGIPAKEVPTGREHVFIECAVNGSAYHLVGGVDLVSGEFCLTRLERYNGRGYLRAIKKKEVIQCVTEMLKGIDADYYADFTV
jgi:hypothetical protein